MRYSLTSSLASVAPIAGHGWRGGCSGRRNGGWHWRCFDLVAYDTAAPYLRRSPHTDPVDPALDSVGASFSTVYFYWVSLVYGTFCSVNL